MLTNSRYQISFLLFIFSLATFLISLPILKSMTIPLAIVAFLSGILALVLIIQQQDWRISQKWLAAGITGLIIVLSFLAGFFYFSR